MLEFCTTSQSSRLGHNADFNSLHESVVGPTSGDVCFSNRPFEVKLSQTIRHCDVDVAHGLALLFGMQPLFEINRLAEKWDNFLPMMFQGFSKQCPTFHSSTAFTTERIGTDRRSPIW